jgi:c-di-GMP-binding flagellar brake protein YcgR
VRTFEFRRQPYRHTVIGARFEALAATAEKQLEQYLVLLQRQQRREFLT